MSKAGLRARIRREGLPFLCGTAVTGFCKQWQSEHDDCCYHCPGEPAKLRLEALMTEDAEGTDRLLKDLLD